MSMVLRECDVPTWGGHQKTMRQQVSIPGGSRLETQAEPSSVQFSSATQSCPTLCDPMNCSTPSLPVHHQLLESTQTHVHRVGDATQPSHPLSSPSPALNLSHHQGLFASGGRSIGVSTSVSVLPVNTQD